MPGSECGRVKTSEGVGRLNNSDNKSEKLPDIHPLLQWHVGSTQCGAFLHL
jgi:hypothetical protein